MCLKYCVQVQMNKTCNDWDGGHFISSAPELGLNGGMHYHDTIRDGVEAAALESGRIALPDE